MPLGIATDIVDFFFCKKEMLSKRETSFNCIGENGPFTTRFLRWVARGDSSHPSRRVKEASTCNM